VSRPIQVSLRAALLALWSLLLVRPAHAQAAIEFTAGGPLAYGGAEWQANGLINRVIFYPGDVLEVGLVVGMRLPDGDVNLPYRMQAALAIKPLHTPSGLQLPYDPREPWSPFTEAGIPLTNVNLPVRLLQTVETSEIAVVDDRTLSFRLLYRVPLPNDLEDGYYALMLLGSAAIGDSEPFDWYENRIFSTRGTAAPGAVDHRLPLVLRVGDASPPLLEWVLNGQALPKESFAALTQSNAIIQPPGPMNLAPALAALSFPPVFPSGGLTGRIESLGTRRLLGPGITLVQNTIPLPITTFVGIEQRGSFFQLQTADPAYNVEFVRYGIYRVILRGTINDRFGNQYRGGGTYEVAIAEPLTLTPRIPDGYPLPVGEPLTLGFSALPSVGGQAEITVDFTPADGSPPIQRLFLGSLRAGRFQAHEPIQFETSGVYRIRYRAQALDAEERLWFGERVSVGVVAAGSSPIVARGRRGLEGYTRTPLAHFDSAVYPFDAVLSETLVNTPYHSGDLVTLAPSDTTALRPVLTFQDLRGDTAARLLVRLRGFSSAEGSLDELLRRDSLPVVYPGGYGFLTLSAPAGTIHVFGQGSADGAYVPRIALNNFPVGAALLWFGGVRLTDPVQVAGYGAGVRIGEQGARVEPGAEAASQWLTLQGGDGLITPPRHTVEWWLQAFPPRPVGSFSVRLQAPNGRSVRVPAQPVGDFGLYRVVVDGRLLNQVGVWQLAFQNEPDRATLVTARWAVLPQQQLTLSSPSLTPLSSGQASVRVNVPTGWRSVRGTVIVHHPQGTVETREVSVTGASWNVNLNRSELLRRAPWAGVGPLRVTLLLSGQDVDGQPALAARELTLQARRLIYVD
jgi:hypothetical protein